MERGKCKEYYTTAADLLYNIILYNSRTNAVF